MFGITRSPIDFLGSGSVPWNPSLLGSNLLQNFASPLTYSPTKIGGLPVIPSTIGTLAQPRGRRCALFDGVNDYAISPIALDMSASWTVAFWFQIINLASFTYLFSYADPVTGGVDFYANQTDGKIGYIAQPPIGSALSANTWYHFAVSKTGSTLTVYINGSIIGSFNDAPTSTSGNLVLGAVNYNAFLYYGSSAMYDARAYSVAKTPTEIAAIYNQQLTPDVIDTAGAVLICPMLEEAGTVHYNIVDPTKNLTATNVTTSTYHSTDVGVNYSFPNELGYTLSGSTVIPRNEANPTQDCAGNPLQFAGPIALPATVEVPCWTGNGTNAYVELPTDSIPTSGDHSGSVWVKFPASVEAAYTGILVQNRPGIIIPLFGIQSDGSNWRLAYGTSFLGVLLDPTPNAWSKVSWRKVGTTLYASLNDGAESSVTCDATIDSETLTIGYVKGGAYTAASVSDLRITVGGVTKVYPLQEGPGSSNTNRDVYWYASNGTSGVVPNAVINGTVATMWSNRTDASRDACIENGGGIAANGAFVVGVPGSANDAAGNAKTIPVGSHGNPFSRFIPNNWDVPSLVNIGSTSSDKYAPSDTVQAESVADTRFRKPGWSKYFAVRSALTGTDKSNAEGYVA